MALPKLNESIKYSVKVPSTGETVRYRPYLVKEEKVLMIALEQGDEQGSLEAIADTLEACIEEPINIRNLPIFDIEYLFTKIIKISSDVTLEMKYPTLRDIGPKLHKYKEGNQTDQAFDMIAACIDAVQTKDERILLADESEEEVNAFIESFSTEQFGKVRDFIENMPRLKHNVEFECGNCGHENKLTLQGTADFF